MQLNSVKVVPLEVVALLKPPKCLINTEIQKASYLISLRNLKLDEDVLEVWPRGYISLQPLEYF